VTVSPVLTSCDNVPSVTPSNNVPSVTPSDDVPRVTPRVDVGASSVTADAVDRSVDGRAVVTDGAQCRHHRATSQLRATRLAPTTTQHSHHADYYDTVSKSVYALQPVVQPVVGLRLDETF